ncbi:hypothetical protein [Brevibacterium aurantiacum]|uniref:Uncharacterized protein n=1 Tax=Brevibacterium aurantiacum TaxID=273384 RepID=A0A556C5G7_BREAU|nr:hypothetical protein [Brevibacterium aurantiacum]TSI12631.1 hypothetical protein FO013_19340 [Brevibacterium aurantiacum]
MAAKFVHAVDTRTGKKVKVPEQHLKIFPYLRARDPKTPTAPQRPAPQVVPPTAEIIKGGK